MEKDLVESVKDLVEYIVKALVDKPEDVGVNVVDGEKNMVVEVRVATDDTGKVIGKKGRIAKSIRVILSVVGVKHEKHITLEILDD